MTFIDTKSNTKNTTTGNMFLSNKNKVGSVS